MKPVTCHICDYPVSGGSEEQTFCVRCGADLADPTVETKRMEAALSATYATADKMTAVRKQASAYLTDKRLIVIPAKLSGFGLAGALTAVAYNAMTNKSGVISIPLEHVKTVREGKFGLLVKALIVETTGGELVKITVPKRNQWREELTKAANC